MPAVLADVLGRGGGLRARAEGTADGDADPADRRRPAGPVAPAQGRAPRSDVLVTAPAGTALAAVASALAQAVSGGDGSGTVGAVRRGAAARRPALHTRRAPADRRCRAVPGRAGRAGAAPRAGRRPGPAPGGRRPGRRRGPSAARRRDPHRPLRRRRRAARRPGRLPAALRGHRRAPTAASRSPTWTPRTARRLDGARVGSRAVRFAPGALLRIGESALRLAPAGGPGARGRHDAGRGGARARPRPCRGRHGTPPARDEPGPAGPSGPRVTPTARRPGARRAPRGPAPVTRPWCRGRVGRPGSRAEARGRPRRCRGPLSLGPARSPKKAGPVPGPVSEGGASHEPRKARLPSAPPTPRVRLPAKGHARLRRTAWSGLPGSAAPLKARRPWPPPRARPTPPSTVRRRRGSAAGTHMRGARGSGPGRGRRAGRSGTAVPVTASTTPQAPRTSLPAAGARAPPCGGPTCRRGHAGAAGSGRGPGG